MKGMSKRSIYRKISEAREQIGTYHSKRAAAAYFASTLGIDVYRLLQDSQDQLNELQKIGTPTSIIQKTLVKKIKESPRILVNEKVIETFLLPKNLAIQAREMSDTYPYFYIFENLLRYVIISTLEKKYGQNWWNIVTISKDIKDNVEKRKKSEGKDRWVGKRGSHDVFYTDLGDLGLIINSNYDNFKDLFPGLTWVKSRVDDVEKSRNILAHNNPLPDNEMKRIRLYLEDLQKQLAGRL